MFRIISSSLIFILLISQAHAGNWNKSSGTSNKLQESIKQIMLADSKKGFKFDERNVIHKDAFQIVDHEGITAAKIQLRLDMGGAEGDWIRNGRSGYAQRFEYGEKKNRTQPFNKEVWTQIVFWIPDGTVSMDQTTLFDLKEIRDKKQFGPLLNLALRDDGHGTILKIKHHFEKNDCIIGRDGSSENSFCDKIDTNVIIGPVENFTGRWVEFVSRAVWSNKSDGAFDAWIDGEKIMGHRGNTSFGADSISFKFGLYRIELDKIKNPDDIEIYFAKVGTASQCEELAIDNCQQLTASLSILGYSNIKRIFKTDHMGKSDFISRGGKVLKSFE